MNIQDKASIAKKNRAARWHTIYSIISSILEGCAIAVGLIWLLPALGVPVAAWIVILVLICFALFAYIMYRIGHPTIGFDKVTAPDSIIGRKGVVETRLGPEGYVKVHGELWRAVAIDQQLERGEKIVVTGIDGLKLTVEQIYGPPR